MKQNHQSLRARIDAYTPDDPEADFPFSARLARENGWSAEFTDRVIEEYKRFAYLAAVAGHPVTPSDQVDQAWHLHMIYTRSYWDDFCGEVLGMPLHHGPTKGGGEERDKYTDWYGRTLDSYREIFGEEPPENIWPTVRRRFGEDIDFRRVNKARNWVIPKPRWWRRPGSALSTPRRPRLPFRNPALTALATVLLAAGLSSCKTILEGNHWPMDRTAKDFLTLNAIAGAIGILAAFGLQRYFRAIPKRENTIGSALLADPYAVAYLAGREDRATDVALVKLLEYGAIEGKPKRGKVIRTGELPTGAHPFEAAAYGMIGGISGAKVTAIRRAMRPQFTSVKREVERAGFALGSGRVRAIAALTSMLALAAPAIGWVRFYHGIEREMPIGNLFALNCVLTTFALGMFAKGKHRSLEGDLTLEGLRESHRGEGHGGHEGGLAYAFALTGTAALEGTQHADFIPALATRDSSSVSSDGCGGDSGCGGCGGCGCGG